eukprot:GHUV01032693.1.p1 GENE.GHUV01032693.1~~GHUV01032693.1.p1  ORF type:complete len:208 (-),score=18.61 GHUV01032693.1:51-674(-)
MWSADGDGHNRVWFSIVMFPCCRPKFTPCMLWITVTSDPIRHQLWQENTVCAHSEYRDGLTPVSPSRALPSHRVHLTSLLMYVCDQRAIHWQISAGTELLTPPCQYVMHPAVLLHADFIINAQMLLWGSKHVGTAGVDNSLRMDTDPATTWRDMAISHARQVAANHVRPDGTTYHIVEYDPGTGAQRYNIRRVLVVSTYSVHCVSLL